MLPIPVRIILVVLVVLIIAVVATSIKFVQQSKAYVVERLGAFHAIWTVGPHFKINDHALGSDGPVGIGGGLFGHGIAHRQGPHRLKEQVVDFPPQPVITKDNVTMQIDTVLYFQITDPKLYAYVLGPGREWGPQWP